MNEKKRILKEKNEFEEIKNASPSLIWDWFVGEQSYQEFVLFSYLSVNSDVSIAVGEYVEDEVFESNFGSYPQYIREMIKEKLTEYIKKSYIY